MGKSGRDVSAQGMVGYVSLKHRAGDVSHQRGKGRKYVQEPATMEAVAPCHPRRNGSRLGRMDMVDGSP